MGVVRYSGSAMRWAPAAIGAAVSTAVVVIRHNHDAAAPLQMTSILLASAAAFALDDSAAECLDATTTSMLRRRLTRVAVLTIPIAATWGVLVWVQGPGDAAEGWALASMFAGLLGLGIGIAGIAGRLMPPGRGGLVAGPALLIAILTSTTLPPRWRPLPLGDIPGGWAAIYTRWISAAITGSLVFLWSSRDRARRSTLIRR